MAKAAKPKLTPEQKQVIEERAKREKEEEKQLKKRQAEKLAKKKAKDKRIEKRKKLETKRRKSLINLPFKLLFQVSTLITMLSFIVMLFGYESTLVNAIFYSFLIFVAIYLGAGTVMIAVFFLISQDKLVELEEQRKIDEEKLAIKKKEEEKELEEMVALEKQIASKKLASMQGSSIPSRNYDEEGFMLGEGSNNSDLDFINSGFGSSNAIDMEKEMMNNAMKNESSTYTSSSDDEDFDFPDINSFNDIDTIDSKSESIDDSFVPSENEFNSL